VGEACYRKIGLQFNSDNWEQKIVECIFSSTSKQPNTHACTESGCIYVHYVRKCPVRVHAFISIFISDSGYSILPSKQSFIRTVTEFKTKLASFKHNSDQNRITRHTDWQIALQIHLYFLL